MWVNIHCGWYDFDQRFRDASIIETLKKQDIVDFFRQYFFSTPTNPIRRLSIHLESQKLTPEQIHSLVPAFESLGLEPQPNKEDIEKFALSRPTIEAAKGFAEMLVKASGKGEEEVEKMKGEIEKLREREVGEGVEVIQDFDEWRMKQEKAPFARPVKEVSHLSLYTLAIVTDRTFRGDDVQYADLFPARM